MININETVDMLLDEGYVGSDTEIKRQEKALKDAEAGLRAAKNSPTDSKYISHYENAIKVAKAKLRELTQTAK